MISYLRSLSPGSMDTWVFMLNAKLILRLGCIMNGNKGGLYGENEVCKSASCLSNLAHGDKADRAHYDSGTSLGT